jgi:hypothetical protein
MQAFVEKLDLESMQETIKLLMKEIDLTQYDDYKNCILTYFIGLFILCN